MRKASAYRRYGRSGDKTSLDTPKKGKFDYEVMKEAATHKSPAVRKQAFIEYFERFGEFPSYLFENESKIDERLLETMQDLLKDPETSNEMQKGIETLMARLSPEV